MFCPVCKTPLKQLYFYGSEYCEQCIDHEKKMREQEQRVLDAIQWERSSRKGSLKRVFYFPLKENVWQTEDERNRPCVSLLFQTAASVQNYLATKMAQGIDISGIVLASAREYHRTLIQFNADGASTEEFLIWCDEDHLDFYAYPGFGGQFLLQGYGRNPDVESEAQW